MTKEQREAHTERLKAFAESQGWRVEETQVQWILPLQTESDSRSARAEVARAIFEAFGKRSIHENLAVYLNGTSLSEELWDVLLAPTSARVV
jgi:hypothetical protein